MDKLKVLLYLVVDFVLPKSKAFIAFGVTALVSFLASKGVEVDGQSAEAGVLFLSGLVTALCVYLVPNRE